MNTQDRIHWSKPEQHHNSILLVLLIALGSFVVGVMPIVYSSLSADTAAQTSAIAGETSLWGAFSEKE
ncbi:hypothetical protein H6F88_21830 [Oculatella sp. FACHB-28]|uniref:hypothetical protein n=1 Tax=Cyanophyceae TaxID=3028117 RepID=UPI00168596B7|nr:MULTISPECIES: hypothetical protein [Cyanophyceae]MBD1865772.1 hypothetical protein [Cyanobacteria bacterium FACHB-471]MBD2058605.1 hypothetical protein [Oculatella sp. FACHB-28]MBD2066508.1 hypothetical protein [Leptolyngbya sp. FACHB-671]